VVDDADKERKDEWDDKKGLVHAGGRSGEPGMRLNLSAAAGIIGETVCTS
jgi:hypothetical protein